MYEILNGRVRDLLEEGLPFCAVREDGDGNTWIRSALQVCHHSDLSRKDT